MFFFRTYNDEKSKASRRKNNQRYKKSFQTKKELIYAGIKDIRNIFRQEAETKGITDRILRGIKNLFEHEEENYYKPIRVNNFWSNDYIECESNGAIEIKHYQLKNILIKLGHI